MVAFGLEANDTEKLSWVPIQKETLPRRRNNFLSSVVSGIGAPDYQINMSYIHNSPIFKVKLLYSPIFLVKAPIFLLYFRSKSPIFSYISGLNLLYFRQSPIFFGSLVA